MSRTLSPAQVQQYERDGIFFPVPVLTTDELLRFRSAFEELEACLGSTIKRIDQCHLFFRWARDLAIHPAVLDAVEAILGPDLLIWGTLILCKPPQSLSYVSWHQDGTYAGSLGAAPSVSAWIALSESTVDGGCMRVIPGSHRQQLPHHETVAQHNLLKRGQMVEAEIDETQARDVVLKAAEMSLHHINLIHGSNTNRSETKRLGFIVRFITPQIQQAATPLVRARGSADCGHILLVEGPLTGNMEEAIAAHANYVRQRETRR